MGIYPILKGSSSGVTGADQWTHRRVGMRRAATRLYAQLQTRHKYQWSTSLSYSTDNGRGDDKKWVVQHSHMIWSVMQDLQWKKDKYLCHMSLGAETRPKEGVHQSRPRPSPSCSANWTWMWRTTGGPVVGPVNLAADQASLGVDHIHPVIDKTSLVSDQVSHQGFDNKVNISADLNSYTRNWWLCAMSQALKVCYKICLHWSHAHGVMTRKTEGHMAL